MRSLSLLDVRSNELLPASGSSTTSIVDFALDVGSENSYVLSQSVSDEGTIDLSVFKIVKDQPADEFPVPVVEWTTAFPPLSSPSQPRAVLSFDFLPELDSLIAVLSNGDIEQIFSPDSSQPVRENVGTIDAGILTACWSPDEEILSIVTGENQLLLLTKAFAPLSEAPLHSGDFGADAPVDVGWGAKETQFHGSVGKEAAAAMRAAKAHELATGDLASPDDDALPRIRWRGDAAYFAVSSVERALKEDGEERRRRRVRVFGRVGELSASSEPTSGLEGALAWQPTGELIASTQRLGKTETREETHQVVFFERNGLRRYEFLLRDEGKVRELGWNADSSLLAVWLERPGGRHEVQVWHRNNYHWYLKQALRPGLASSNEKVEVQAFLWHPEEAAEIYITTAVGVETFSLKWDTFASKLPPPRDDGAVAVTDGASLLLTPFRLVQIPPPMSAVSLPLAEKATPSHVTFSSTWPGFAALQPEGRLEVYHWPLVLSGPGKKAQAREGIPSPVLEWSSDGALGGYAIQAALVGEGETATAAVLVCGAEGQELVLARKKQPLRRLSLAERVSSLVAGKDRVILETASGELLEVSTIEQEPFALPAESLSSLPEFCPTTDLVQLDAEHSTLVGLASSGRLYSGSRLLAPDATSFQQTADFLLYTTFAHELKFVPLPSLLPFAEPSVVHTEGVPRPSQEAVELKRTVERGARIVTVAQSSTSVVLQMPRGNLETVCPRPLVLRIVRQHLDERRYRAAFLACRRHRIDLNVLYDHDPRGIEDNLGLFITQVKEVDYLNLFLSGLKDEDVTQTMYKNLLPFTGRRHADAPGKVNRVCDLVRLELEREGSDVFAYANTILTTHVRKRPQDYESALKVLVQLKAVDPARAEDAVKYIIFLSDANKLFDLALGMYDFPLVLMIAQQSQKDPREYLPFLRDLRQYETYLQRFKIDDHLQRHNSALRNLAKAGPEQFDQAVEYTRTHALYATALEAFEADPAKHRIILAANAEHLEGRKHYAEAGLLFSLAGEQQKAMEAYKAGHAWQEVFTLAMGEKLGASAIKALAIEVAEGLRSKRRYAEAGRVLLEYARDVEAAVEALNEGALYAESIRLTSLYNKRELIETHVKPSTLDLQQRLVDDCDELTEQIEKQVDRLSDLRLKRESNPNSFYCVEELPDAMQGLSLQPDSASDAGTAFTRYTVAGAQSTTTMSSAKSAKTAKSRRKASMKKAAGKKGSVYEETYLFNSVKKSVEVRLLEIHAEVAPLLPVLVSLRSASHRTAALALQARLAQLERFLEKQIEVIWTPKEDEWRNEEVERQEKLDRGDTVDPPVEQQEGRERVVRPKVSGGKWRIGLLARED